jgi:beta-lactamase superfamily II metal-dependent hydrolase
MATHYILADLVKVYNKPIKKYQHFLTVLAWGDEVEVIKDNEKTLEIGLKNFIEKPDGSILPQSTTGYIFKSSKRATKTIIAPVEQKDVMMVTFVDVQQGDACVLETPKGKTVLIDGGENQMFARYLATRYGGTSLNAPKDIDCIIISHGDADHFEGLPKILESEKHSVPKKRFFMNPHRVYHNGLVKRPQKDKNDNTTVATKMFGSTIDKGNQKFISALENDLLLVPDEEMNAPFKRWKRTLAVYKERNAALLLKRLDHTSTGDFNFLADEHIEVKVLGPITEKIAGNTTLKFLRQPSKSVEIDENRVKKAGSYSASHTVNGHSIILKFTYGNVNFLFSGDLNEEAEDILVGMQQGNKKLIRSEILKVPHHGSADFANSFFEAVNPLVSIVSSGDESENKEYIHPRATLMGVLGKYARYERPLVFVTELVAFFKREGWARVTDGKKKDTPLHNLKEIYAFSRTAYGSVHVRTNGEKLFVFTHSGQKDLKEAYSFIISADGEVERKDVVIK